MYRRFASAIVLCGCMTAPALAAPSYSFEVDETNTIPGITARKLIADGDGLDWTAALFILDLTQGSVYNGSPNSDRPQDGFWGIPGFEILRWDTWFGIPGGINDVGPLGPGDLGSHLGPLIDDDHIGLAWGGTGTTNTGPTQIANVSLTDDAVGSWQLIISFEGNELITASGIIVPEPGTLALLGAGAVLFARRRLA